MWQLSGSSAAGLLFAFLMVMQMQQLPTAAALPECSELNVQGLARFPVGSCTWPKQPPAPRQNSIHLMGAASGPFPGVLLSAPSNSTPSLGATTAGMNLTIKRIVLMNVTVAPPANSTTSPKLVPLGLFAAPVRHLSLQDVRFLVPVPVFEQYLSFFQKHLFTVKTKNDGGVGMHTDGTSFLNIPFWSDAYTELSTVTIMTGPCIIPPNILNQPLNKILGVMADVPGCNVRSVTNDTIIPVLQRDATINTTVPLLIRVVTNVTLGTNLPKPIVFARPVLIVGSRSAPVSVDLQMVVNQFNVTRRNAQLAWQAVVLENMAPGDATSAALAPPYSTTVTTNLWAVYCNRSKDVCLILTNCTLVLPSADEISYLTFMSTMYNSPSPALQEYAGFYRTDLQMTSFDVAQGPTVDSMTVVRIVTNTWNLWYCVVQTQRVFARQLPAPRQVFNQLQYKTGVLVQAITDCSSLQDTQRFAHNRVHVWQLSGNVSIGGTNCTPVNVSGPTTLIGDVETTVTPSAPAEAAPSMRHIPLNVSRVAVPNITQPLPQAAEALAAPPPPGKVYSLSFQYTVGLIQIPADAPDRYLQVRNTTLWQLPQAHSPSVPSTAGSRRRLLQEATAAPTAGTVSLPTAMPSGVFTILLWPFNRSMSGLSLTVIDTQMMLPQAEWDLIAQAANSRNFAIDLQDSSALLFSKVSRTSPGVLTVGSFKGPGITGSNVRLVPDPAAATAMPGYTWPVIAAAAGSVQQQQRPGLSRGAAVGLGVALAVLAALAIGAVVLLFIRRHRRLRAFQSVSDGLKQRAVASLAAARDDSGAGSAAAEGSSLRVLVQPGKDSALARDVSAGDLGAVRDQFRAGSDDTAAAAAVAAGDAARRHSHGSSSGGRAAGVGGVVDANCLSEPLPFVALSGSTGGSCPMSGSTVTPSVVGSTLTPLDATPRDRSEADEVESAIKQGLQQWNDAVSMQTIRLMQQRLQASSLRSMQRPASASTTASSTRVANVLSSRQSEGSMGGAAGADAAAAAGGGSSRGGSPHGSGGGNRNEDVRLFQVIGTGSFGAVHLGSWRGKQVAVKVMHLPANAFAAESNPQQLLQQAQQRNGQLAGRQQHMRQQNSRPHMAIMEAVLSTNLHHPNVVQVYTYMLSPLMASNTSGPNSAAPSRQQSGGGWQPALQQQQPAQQQQQEEGEEGQAGAGSDRQEHITGFMLQLVMEYCDQGTLRDQLDRQLLPHLPGSSFVHPAVAVALSHDVAAAMLHLHREGIVHGDLKAGNALLQASTGVGRAGSGDQQQELLRVWTQAGCLPLTAKVADFGLALPLGPTDTHATLLARTPTHMAPELFTSGHVGKGSDVYAFGVLLYELVTGMRAYAGVPIPLLPHRVAVEGLRPTWPSGVPVGLMRLAESCWVQKPQHRPDFQAILTSLESVEVSEAAAGTAGQQYILHVPTTAAVAAAGAAAGAAGQQPCPLPPLPNRPKQQQQQQPQQQQAAGMQRQRSGNAAGVWTGGATNRNSPAVQGGEGMEWSEVSYGGRAARLKLDLD